MKTKKKVIGALVTEDEHYQFKQWCLDNDLAMTKVMRNIIVKLMKNIPLDIVIAEVITIVKEKPTSAEETYKHKTIIINGESYEAPLPCQVSFNSIIVPGDTSENDIELLSRAGRAVITNADWKTIVPLKRLKVG